MQYGIFNSNVRCPSGKTLSFAAKGDDMILACVASLLAASSPVAVVLEIPKIAIASFDAMLCSRRLAHVCVEVLKRQPSLAYRNAFGSVAIITNMIRIAASLNHAIPAPIDRQMRQSVCGDRFSKPLSFVASATNDVAFSKVGATMNCLSPAFATAKPVRAKSGADGGKFQNSQLSKGLPSQVFDALWNSDRLLFSHDTSPESRLVRMARQLQLSGHSHFSSLILREQR